MKKSIVFAVAAAALCFMTGCTTVETTKKFNSMGIGDNRATPVAHVNAKIEGWYLFCIFPLLTGSVNDTGKCAGFTDTVTVENLVGLLTERARGKGGNRVLDLQTRTGSFNLLFLLQYRYVEGSCNTIR